MSTRTVERVDGWESVPFEGGFAGLQKLAGQEFTGAVIAGPTRLFMLNGTVVGVLDGSIEDFESASGTAKRSPHEALPLLAVMQERADEVKAQYYTEDTELAEVDRTLSSGNFTGFIELSENVLSGDYYTVYHQGRSMSVAWVGNSDKLLTDDEAFETANDEVGIYEVMPVDIEPIEIPEPEEDTGAAETAPADGPEETDDAPTTTGSDTATSDTDPSGDAAATAATGDPDGGSDSGSGSEPAPERSSTGGPPGSKAAGANPGGSQRSRETDDHPAAGVAGQSQAEIDAESQSEPAQPRGDQHDPERTTDTAAGDTATRDDTAARTDTTTQSESPDTATQPSQTEDPLQSGAQSAPVERDRQVAERGAEQTTSQRTETTSSESATTSAEPAAGSGGASADLETRSIPSLDPNKSGNAQANDQASVATTPAPPSGSTPASTPRRDQPAADSQTDAAASEPAATDESTEPAGTPERESDPSSTQQPSTEQSQPAAEAGRSPRDAGHVAELESELEAKTATVTELEAELTGLEATNQELRAEVDRLESDLADARAEIDRLNDQLDAQDDTVAGGTRLSVSEAINGTNLFVRYNSKGKVTLEEARDGEASREEVEANLRLEYHTQFEAEDASVNGTPFQAFLEDSIQYRFVNWLIRNLLYEIRDTGHAGAMKDLYEGLPAIDRAELNGKVTVVYTEDGQENRSQERFDIVVRDRMGNPLVVANINDSREPATEGQMTDLVRNAERVGNASDSFASAFLVTSSFFEPGALETAKEATSSGLFNRDKRKSFVNLSRKEGFHLCLLEARNQEFHLAVPEL